MKNLRRVLGAIESAKFGGDAPTEICYAVPADDLRVVEIVSPHSELQEKLLV